jgi:hypothetical protein
MYSASPKNATPRVDDVPTGMPPSFLGFGGALSSHTPPDDVLSRTFDHLDHFDMNGMNSALNMISSLQGIDNASGIRGRRPAPTFGLPITMFRHQV